MRELPVVSSEECEVGLLNVKESAPRSQNENQRCLKGFKVDDGLGYDLHALHHAILYHTTHVKVPLSHCFISHLGKDDFQFR